MQSKQVLCRTSPARALAPGLPLTLQLLPMAAMAAALFSGAAPAWAAEQGVQGNGVAGLPTVEVAAVPEKTAGVAKLNQSVKETPQSVTIIDKAQMDEQNLRTLDEVLQQSTGITVQPYTLLTTGYYARGFKIDSFEQDGVPILMGNTAAPPQDMAIYERVEILRGANGLLHGSGNPAATVNLVPKRPQRKFAASAALSAGSWDRYRAEVDLGGPLNETGTLRGRVVASHEDRGYFYDVGKQKSSNLYGVAELDLGRDTTLGLGVYHQEIRSTTNMAGVPFYSNGADLGLSRSTYLDAAWDRFNWDTTRVFGDLEHRFDNGWKAKLSVNHLSSTAFLKYAGASGAINPVTGTGARLTGAAYQFSNSQSSLDVYASGPVQLLGREHELMLGANYLKTETQQYTAALVPALNVAVNVFNWDPYSVAEPGVSNYTTTGPTRLEQSGVYAMGRFSLAEPLKLVIGGRISNWKQTTLTTRKNLSSELTPYGGLIFALTPQWSLYGSYAQIFQPQTQTTAAGDLIDPIRGTNYEGGIKGELAGGRLNVSLAAFQINQTNRAQQDPAAPCVGTVCSYIASGEVRSRGIEAEANGRITDNLNVTAGYTFNLTEYVKDAASQGLPFASFTPKHILRVWTNYTLPWMERRLSAGLGMQAQSEYKVTSGGVTLRQGTYGLVNARIGYRFSERVSAALNVANLFDKRYYQSLSSSAWNNRYGDPRNITLTVRAEY